MSSTEGEKGASPSASAEPDIEVVAARFFDEVLSPLALRLRQGGLAPADVSSRRAAESFYEPVPAFTRADFEIVSGGDPATLRTALLRQWKDEPTLHALADSLARLSEEVGVDREQSAEVSPFLYVMF